MNSKSTSTSTSVLTSALFFYLLLLGVAELAAAGRAPDVAPDLPENWCDLRHGTPTRSTGECICRSNCQGSGCQKESGVIWFAYAKCPTCQCVGSDVKTRFTPSDADLARNQEIEAEQRRQQLMNEEPPREVEEEDEVFDILDWIDDNLNYVFAGAVTMGVMYIFVTIISGGLQSQGGASASDSASAKKRKDEKNAEDSDKDK